jgi:hypothetical protein
VIFLIADSWQKWLESTMLQPTATLIKFFLEVGRQCGTCDTALVSINKVDQRALWFTLALVTASPIILPSRWMGHLARLHSEWA